MPVLIQCPKCKLSVELMRGGAVRGHETTLGEVCAFVKTASSRGGKTPPRTPEEAERRRDADRELAARRQAVVAAKAAAVKKMKRKKSRKGPKKKDVGPKLVTSVVSGGLPSLGKR